ncbi:polysaccharide deacetylase family protein [Legionella sp. MW5194]|uniref:polysaccharide deacetylase family protein n=1 Tax=Legionella sp. MW5194 TaxID=2662448 RepID=UPI001AFAA554|nr:polysaccharide deacetylase family protein [Legionella sp. MW5194]QRN03699.1 polysaccharide deacetylase family protein [Legionella sp. MW5194]
MLKNHRQFVLGLMCFCCSTLFAQVREIAITIDDLPFVGSTHNDPGRIRRENERLTKILDTLNQYNVPATGFVIAGTIEKDQWQLLEKFRDDGYQLGNHTYSHRSLNSVTAHQYTQDIKRADKVLAPLLVGTKYFRYPYLAESQGEKKQQVYEFLTALGYVIAPVTVDSKDFQFNAQFLAIHWRNRQQNLPSFKKRYLNFIWNQTLKAEAKAKKRGDADSRQILLIHANLLNSLVLKDIIEMYQKNGYKIVSLDAILSTETRPGEGNPKAMLLSPLLKSLLEKSPSVD